jgi:two-component system response regulator GlrR
MIGKSQAFLNLQNLIQKISACDAPVLIEGETGTGKELAARAIHYGGARREGPFVPVNCGAIPDALIENELFGHKQGAYTDAKQDHIGLVGHAQGGTLFLDEVDALTPKAQVALLRFLQDRQYRPLGGHGDCAADVRIITACNTDLAVLSVQGTFRQDLYYRLTLMSLKLPPLRDRRGDAVLLAEHFLSSCAVRYGACRTLAPATTAWLGEYCWPGNIRELENLIYREYLLADSAVIHIQSRLAPNGERRKRADRRAENITEFSFNQAKCRAISEFERRYLDAVLTAAEGNVTRAANLVGKERRSLGKLLKKHGIDRQQYAD